MAVEMGIRQDVIDRVTPETLEELIEQQSIARETERQNWMTTTAAQRRAPETPNLQGAEPRPEPGDGLRPAAERIMTQEEALELHPTIARELREMRAELNELRTMREQFGWMQQRERQREYDGFQQRCDAAFNQFPILGKGDYQTIGGADMRKRQAVLDAVGRDQDKGTFEQKIARAVADLYGEQMAQGPIAEPAAPAAPAAPPLPRDGGGRITGARPTAEEWAAAATPMPSQRNTPELPPGPERAKVFVREEMKKRDIFAGEPGPNGVPNVREEDTLP
jgi:hypothetical protein